MYDKIEDSKKSIDIYYRLAVILELMNVILNKLDLKKILIKNAK